MVVPLPSKQIAPGQYRYTPPSPLYGLGPITRFPSCGGQNISAVSEEHSRCLFIRYRGVKFNEFMFRFSGLAARARSRQKDGDSAPPGVCINSVIKYVRQRLRLRPYTSKD